MCPGGRSVCGVRCSYAGCRRRECRHEWCWRGRCWCGSRGSRVCRHIRWSRSVRCCMGAEVRGNRPGFDPCPFRVCRRRGVRADTPGPDGHLCRGDLCGPRGCDGGLHLLTPTCAVPGALLAGPEACVGFAPLGVQVSRGPGVSVRSDGSIWSGGTVVRLRGWSGGPARKTFWLRDRWPARAQGALSAGAGRVDLWVTAFYDHNI